MPTYSSLHSQPSKLSMLSAVEDPPVCSGRLCSFCHGEFETQYRKQFANVPSYARPTAAATRRAIAIYNQTRTRSSIPSTYSPAKLGFEDLPAEIRLQIYRSCLQEPNIRSLNVLISAWVRGGGFHADRKLSRYSPLMHIHASHSFPRNLLALNKRIHREALLELYKNIRFRIAASVVSTHIPQLRYWLTLHPMRLTSVLEIPLTIRIWRQLRFVECEESTRAKVLTVGHMRELASTFARMPNLKQVNIFVVIALGHDETYADAVKEVTRQRQWKKRLSILRGGLPASCKSTIIVKADPTHARVSELIRLEQGFVKIFRDAFGEDAFEVRQFDSSDGVHGIWRYGLHLLLITHIS
ncbi:uncharacterized protein PV09_02166 [Verruconis gallopava]|uniref:Uncharacterized protein n=1 Tax=Verruconis gallopava TaxID=253628 RepID=A0A0D1XWY5_9PEZI|nr:uncharacterized protein PV09_02166 [Verruconis gallopava]KIW07316.1 hypothetical protein PV09_02166 [Verruconis gallopava]